MKHPHLIESRMSYTKHLAHSVKQSCRLIVIAIKSLIHGVFPGIFINSGPLGVYRIYKEVRQMEHIRKALEREGN